MSLLYIIASLLTLSQPVMHICIMSVLFFFHKSIRIYMEVIILGTNTLYRVFCFFKTLLPQQVYFGMVGKGLRITLCGDCNCVLQLNIYFVQHPVINAIKNPLIYGCNQSMRCCTQNHKKREVHNTIEVS